MACMSFSLLTTVTRKSVLMMDPSDTIPRKLENFSKTTVWEVFTNLANKHQAINLGQGFPGWDSPQFVKASLIDAVNSNSNQYCRGAGALPLTYALSKKYSPLFKRNICHLNEITISVGATEGLYSALQSLIDDGDEAVAFEPAFDLYGPQVQMAGGQCKFVPLMPPNDKVSRWTPDFEALSAALTPKTKVLILNTPHNPTGYVFSKEDFDTLTTLLISRPWVNIVVDEVYEHLCYAPHTHIRLGSYPEFWERTITIGSAGKTFSCTGWKIGWLIGPERLIQRVKITNQWVQFSVSTPCQMAMASIISQAQTNSYYEELLEQYEKKRQLVVHGLRDPASGIVPLEVMGTFFLVCDVRGLMERSVSFQRYSQSYMERWEKDGEGSGLASLPTTAPDWICCHWLTEVVGVAAIPLSALYAHRVLHQHPYSTTLIRLCFAKPDEALQEACQRLRQAIHLS